ncbi:low-density lipoprotein receptor-related protein 2-like isoform X2 [Mytilus californianus]|uniref:low-density lipoprotein receptor-related protein 2-like isoform X2 n=1 Tax=Mytilus californianus TaxID=6549 RepID=UPI002247C663|nr:low-density lipoprotein receptor-related protein 2-like isoform X2 [Mytilus californianus]
MYRPTFWVKLCIIICECLYKTTEITMKTLISKCTLFVIATVHLSTVEACNTTEFECTNGECISKQGRCDNAFDCQDKSDEFNCTVVQPCPEGRHKCDNGECVTDINLCPTTMIQLSTSIVEPSSQSSLISPTNTFQIQSSYPSTTSTYDIQPTSSYNMPDNSVLYTTTPLVRSVKPLTPNSKFKPIYFTLLVLLIPIGITVYFICRDIRKSHDKIQAPDKFQMGNMT